ncbi:hypothetical protein ACTXT7_012806 [Hymenolepis weldensis]
MTMHTYGVRMHELVENFDLHSYKLPFEISPAAKGLLQAANTLTNTNLPLLTKAKEAFFKMVRTSTQSSPVDNNKV